MRLGGRLEGAISVLDDIDARRRPVADALKDWGLAHRFAGSGDRAAIGNIVYDALRMRLSHAWLMDDDSASAIAHAVMFRQWGFTPETLAAELVDDKFAPALFPTRRLPPSSPAIFPMLLPISRATFPSGSSRPSKRPSATPGLPRHRRWPTRPTLDLRANILKATREKAVKALDRSGAQDAKIARYGIRIAAGEGASRLPNVTAELSFQKGWFEVQDEGSQIVADLVLPTGGRPGSRLLRRRRRQDARHVGCDAQQGPGSRL
jgi:16S rRNA (cytosine967-C5)-methyltransferase